MRAHAMQVLRADDEAPMTATMPASPRATLLVVDDEPDVCEVLSEYFVAHGYAVIAAPGAAAARELAAGQLVDLALIDINMPGEDGLSLARHLR
jgi:two-component system phosphate regulon response regulator OmpR